MQRGGVRGGGPGRAARDAGSVEEPAGVGRVQAGPPRVERVQASQHAAGAVRRRRGLQGGGEERVLDAGLAYAAVDRHLGMETQVNSVSQLGGADE